MPRQVSPRSWYLVVDAVGTGTDPSFERHPDLDVQVNGKQIKAEVRPFWALDCSQRDNLVYLKTFAYGQGKNIEDIRQWWCVAMPADLVRELRRIKNKSRFIAEAVRERFAELKRNHLETLMIEGYKATAKEDEKINEAWERHTLRDGLDD